MRAMIFAAGLGTRLRPLTNDRPKALVEVAGVNMLERTIRNLAKYGFNEIVVNIHHFGDKIISFLREHDNFGLDIKISDERGILLDTGGGLLKARHLLLDGEPFLVHNADILTDFDLSKFYESHLRSSAIATVLVKERVTQRYLLFNDDYRLCGWVNKVTGETRPEGFEYKPEVWRERAFGGVHVISPSIFELLKEYARKNPVFSIIPFYNHYCNQCCIHGYEPEEAYNWFDVGKPETLKLAEETLSR